MNGRWSTFIALVLSFAQSYAQDPAEEGKQIYLTYGCDACHGSVGHGGAARKLAPNPIPAQAFEAWVRNGSPGWTISRGMPAFPEQILDRDQLQSIYRYLESLPQELPAEEIPLLQLD